MCEYMIISLPLFLIFSGRDVAFNKPTLGSPPYLSWFAYKVVDGRYVGPNDNNDTFLSETCFSGLGISLTYWEVELQRSYDIASCHLFGRNQKSLSNFLSSFSFMLILQSRKTSLISYLMTKR